MPSTFNARDADAYERVMGRWSRRLAPPFLQFAADPAGCRVLDIGCGTGSLTAHLLDNAAATVAAIDLSETYLGYARRRFDDPRLDLRCADASHLPFADGSFDLALSLLALHFMPDPAEAVGEMRRVTRPGGVIAGAVWDVWGGLPHAQMFLDTAAMFDPAGAAMRERYLAAPLTRPDEMARLWTQLGLRAVVQTEIAVRFDFAGFDDYWGGFLTGEGSMGAYVATLSAAVQERLGAQVRAAFTGGGPDAPRSFTATAWACRGIVA